MRLASIALITSLSLISSGAMAAPETPAVPAAKPGESAKPISEKPVSATDVVATPASDLNLRKSEIPALLIEAQTRTYDLAGLRRCPQIAAAVSQLDAILGEDIDVAQARGQKLEAGRVAQSVVGSFIPFRGIIREVSGANGQDRKLQAAILAGNMRRSFLKGVGQERGCGWPARPATAAMVAAQAAKPKPQQR